MHTSNRYGFTLIELSIVLVIIGLIVGGILVGQDLIKAAEIRATVSQVEKFNTAAVTFRNKYNGLPGDFSYAARFGLAATGQSTTAGLGDGNGLMESSCTDVDSGGGETFVFWTHLSQANLIGEPTNSITTYVCNAAPVTATDAVLPPAKIRNGNRFAITSTLGLNYFMLAGIASSANATGSYTSTNNLTPQESFQVDTKMDDGNPSTGSVTSIRSAVPGVLAGGAASPTAATDCYGTSAPATYFTTTAAAANARVCQLGMRASF